MTHLPGELGHSFHLLVLGNLSPPGGASVLPRWPRSDPHPEPMLLRLTDRGCSHLTLTGSWLPFCSLGSTL